jgi:hypothetical protein
MRRWFIRGRRDDDSLGRGLWRRLHDDCSTALREAPERAELLPRVRSCCEQAQRNWPTDSLDVPADPAGLAAYGHLQAVRRALREAAYRDRLSQAGPLGADGGGPQQVRLREQAVRT